MSTPLSDNAQVILGLVQTLRHEDELFLDKYPAIVDFFNAYEALEVLKARYPEFHSEKVGDLINEIDAELYRLTINQQDLLVQISKYLSQEVISTISLVA